MVASASRSHERRAATASGTSPRNESRRTGASRCRQGHPGGSRATGPGVAPCPDGAGGAPRPGVKALTRRWERAIFLAGE